MRKPHMFNYDKKFMNVLRTSLIEDYESWEIGHNNFGYSNILFSNGNVSFISDHKSEESGDTVKVRYNELEHYIFINKIYFSYGGDHKIENVKFYEFSFLERIMIGRWIKKCFKKMEAQRLFSQNVVKDDIIVEITTKGL